MDTNFLFRWIWRLNAVGLLAALFIALAMFGPLFFQMISTGGAMTGMSPYPSTPAPSPTLGPYDLFLDAARPGRDQIVLVLAPRQASAGGYPGFDDVQVSSNFRTQFADLNRVANYLFIDRVSGETRWLFPTNEQTITSTDYVDDINRVGELLIPLSPPIDPKRGGQSGVVLYDVLPGAANADRASAKYQLYISKLDGTQLTKLLDDLDGVPLETGLGGTLAVRYVTKGRLMVATFSLTDFKLIMMKDVSEFLPK